LFVLSDSFTLTGEDMDDGKNIFKDFSLWAKYVVLEKHNFTPAVVCKP
jgi:hypothetical protein